MTDQARRSLLRAAALLPRAFTFGGLAMAAERQSGASLTARFAVQPGQPGRLINDRLTGLSYETLQLADPAFFSADNRALVALFRALSPRGVLRIGGNTSDYTVWSGYRGELPVQHARRAGPQQPRSY